MAAALSSTRFSKALGYVIFTLVALACIGFGIGVYARQAVGYYRAHVAQRWPQVQATIVETQLFDARDTAKGRYLRSRYLKARCEYSFQGVRYVSDCIQTAPTNSHSALARIRDEHAFEPGNLCDLHFDVLIALTAGADGAWLIASNPADFEFIREYRQFKLEVW